MAIADRILEFKAKVADANDQALTELCEAVALDQKGADGTLSQGDVDAAVALQKQADDAALAGQIAADGQALSDAQAASATALSDLQSKLDAMTEKEGLEEKSVKDLQTAMDTVQASWDAVKALFAPVVVPPPVDPPADA